MLNTARETNVVVRPRRLAIDFNTLDLRLGVHRRVNLRATWRIGPGERDIGSLLRRDIGRERVVDPRLQTLSPIPVGVSHDDLLIGSSVPSPLVAITETEAAVSKHLLGAVDVLQPCVGVRRRDDSDGRKRRAQVLGVRRYQKSRRAPRHVIRRAVLHVVAEARGIELLWLKATSVAKVPRRNRPKLPVRRRDSCTCRAESSPRA